MQNGVLLEVISAVFQVFQLLSLSWHRETEILALWWGHKSSARQSIVSKSDRYHFSDRALSHEVKPSVALPSLCCVIHNVLGGDCSVSGHPEGSTVMIWFGAHG